MATPNDLPPPRSTKYGAATKKELSRYEAMRQSVSIPGIGYVTFKGENRFDNRETYDRSTVSFTSGPTGAVPLRWGAGVPMQAQQDTPVFMLGPNGERVPVLGQDKANFAAGNLSLPSVYGAALDPARPGTVTSVFAADAQGNVAWGASPQQDVKFQQQRDKALVDVLSEWSEQNDGAVPTPQQMVMLEQVAERRAMSAISFLIGGNPDNYPASVAPQGAEAIYEAGQILPGFIGGGSMNDRPIDETEAQALNWIKGVEIIGEDERSALMRMLFDPMVPDEQKQEIITQVTDQIRVEAANAQPIEDGFNWTWNPLALSWEVLTKFVLKPFEVIYEGYVDPSLTWTVSALPGGPRTASWKEAQSVAPGQMIATTVGPRLSALMTGPGTLQNLGSNIGAIAEGVSSGNWDNLQANASGFADAVLNNEAPWEDLGDGIYDAEAREEAFEDDFYGSQVSGGIGFATTLIWDPLWLLGPVGKGISGSTRFGMGARGIRSAADRDKQRALITIGRDAYAPYEEAKVALDAAVRAGDDARIAEWTPQVEARKAAKDAAMKRQAPVVQFIDWLLDPATGKRTWQEISQHKVIDDLGAPKNLVSALAGAKTFDEAALTIRAVSGDHDALRALKDLNFSNYLEIRALRVQTSIDSVYAAPDKLTRLEAKMDNAIDEALSEARRLEDEAMLVDTGWQARVAAYEASSPSVRSRNVTPEDIAGSPERLRLQMLEDGNRLIDELSEKLRLARAEGAPAGVIDDILRQLDEAADLANGGLFGPAAASAFPAEARAAHANVARAIDDRNLVVEARNYGRAWTDDQRELASRTLQELTDKNITFKAALRAAEENATQMTNRWFGVGRWQGGARARERAYQRRAQRRAFQMDTHRSGLSWVPQHFKAPGGQKVTLWTTVQGARSLAADAITRPFTYAGMESPAAFIQTDGFGGLDNHREVQATVNNLKSLTPSQREAIVERFSRLSAISDDGMIAVTNFEQDVLRGIATRYADQVDADDVNDFVKDIELMYKFFDGERTDMIESFRSRGFWVDEDGVINRSPFLETQLMNSTPLMDFRRLERMVERYAKDYSKSRRGFSSSARARDARRAEDIAQARLRRADEKLSSAEKALVRAEEGGIDDVIEVARVSVEKTRANQVKLKAELDSVMSDSAKYALANSSLTQSWDKGLRWYDEFQQLWRFGVLFRVGYPVRNSIEGITRRIAYDASIIPVLADGFRGTRNIASNVASGRSSLTPQAVKDRKAAKARAAMEKSGALPRSVAKWADREQRRISSFRDSQIEYRDFLRSSINDLENARASMPAGPARDELDSNLAELTRSVRSFDFVVDDLNVRLKPFAEGAGPDEIITAYRQSLDTPRKIGDEFIIADGRQYYGMRGDPRMSPILEQNASARETVQATLGLRLSSSRALAEAALLSMGGEVLPSARNYFPEITKVLNGQVRNSIVGTNFLQGKSIRDTARAIMREGDNAKEYRSMHNIENFDDAMDRVADAYRELERYIPNPELRRALSRGQVTERVVRQLLDNDEYKSLLVPVHGAQIGPAVGHAPTLIKKFQEFSNRAFEIIGTNVEDAVVRLPFASRVFEKNLKAGLSYLRDVYPNGIPAWAVDQTIKAARVRAIKDTKRFMFTQDRRTNFGRVGERFIPFVSAWQNSVVAYGRLMSRNPESLYYAEQAWLAPDRIGVVDADGNIRIPVPSWMVGKTIYVPGVGDVPISGTTGDEWVYSKDAAYVLVDNTDPGLTFKSGPVFQMTASTLMQAGWLSPAAPSAFRSLFGEEYAQKIWDAGVIATFGADEYGQASAMGVLPLGADKALPAWAQKVVQMMQTGFGNSPENNATYNSYYINNARQMILDHRLGERESFPTAQEIKDRTNGQFLMRGLSNMFGVGGPLGPITPTQQQNDITQMQQVYFMFQDMFGMKADEQWSTLFGDEVSWLAGFRGSKSVAGTPATKRSLIRAQENEDLIRAVAPNISSKSMLSYLLTDGNYESNSGDRVGRVQAWFGLFDGDDNRLDRFDPNVRLMQFLQKIPGTNENWRTALTPEESARQTSIDSGWDMYFKANQAIYAELDAAGMNSLQSAGAAGLAQQRRDFIQQMAGDPLYAAWYEEYNRGFQTRTRDALNMIRAATNDEKFMSGSGADATDMWQAASIWLAERRKYKSEISRLGGTGDEASALRRGWEMRSADLSIINPRFREFWSRYLDNDDLSME